jgi:hypothetical protein
VLAQASPKSTDDRCLEFVGMAFALLLSLRIAEVLPSHCSLPYHGTGRHGLVQMHQQDLRAANDMLAAELLRARTAYEQVRRQVYSTWFVILRSRSGVQCASQRQQPR